MKASDRKKWLSGKYEAMAPGEYEIYCPHKKQVDEGFFVKLSKSDMSWMLTALAKRKEGGE